MENLVSVLYYSANVEDERLERVVMENILKNKGNLRLVSVTQKPVDFGENICVGKKVCCYANEFRQIQLGLRQITTPYVLTAEADCLYPQEYFRIMPRELNKCYRYANVWIYPTTVKGGMFYFKGFSDGAQLISRELWLESITKALGEVEQWSEVVNNKDFPRVQPGTDSKYSWTGNPVISLKTEFGVSKRTQLSKKVKPVEVLPYWGSMLSVNNLIYGSNW